MNENERLLDEVLESLCELETRCAGLLIQAYHDNESDTKAACEKMLEKAAAFYHVLEWLRENCGEEPNGTP